MSFKIIIIIIIFLFFFVAANAKKNKRSKSKDLKLDKLIHQSQAPLPLEFCETMNVPTSANVTTLASDIGVILRKIAQLVANKWKHVPESQRILMIDDILVIFYFISCAIVHGLV